MSGSGWCTHPQRQERSEVRLLVRRGELACRNSWGGDLFSNKDGNESPRPAPDAAYQPTGEQPVQSQIDDEVTSVTTRPGYRYPQTSSPDHQENDEDRVVSDRPSPRRNNSLDDDEDEDDDGRNDPACLDQDERVRVMARGSSDAIARARERILDRRRRVLAKDPSLDTGEIPSDERPLVATHTDAHTASSDGRIVTHRASYSHRPHKRAKHEGASPTSDQPVPRAEVMQRLQHSETSDRYDTIPELDPSFDLPGWRRSHASGEEPSLDDTTTDPQPEAGQTGDSPDDLHGVDKHNPFEDHAFAQQEDAQYPGQSPFEHVLTRARRIRQSNRRPRPSHIRPHHHTAARVSDPEPVQEQLDAVASAPDYPIELAPHPADEALVADSLLESASRGSEGSPDTSCKRRQGGWLAQLGIRGRFARNDHETPAINDDSEYDDADHLFMEEQDQPKEYRALRDRAEVEQPDPEQFSIGEHYDDTDDLNDEFDAWSVDYDDSAAPVGDAIPDDYYGSSGYYEDSTGYYEDSLAEPDPAPAPLARQGIGFELPDLDVLYAASSVPARSRSVAIADHDDHKPQSEVATRAATPDGSYEAGKRTRASRWTRGNGPSESFFRARRFREWDQEHPEHVGAEESRANRAPSEPGYRGVHESFDSQEHQSAELPDLDANTFDLREVVERGAELLDMTIDVASDIPRQCRTCRSFRSADGGSRGWCTNEWAFTHRRMVNEENLACATTIGCWWLPADRYWMPEETTGWLDAAPRMDELMARGDRQPHRKISGD